MKPKDLAHFWLGYIRMLGHLQLQQKGYRFEDRVGTPAYKN